jgi:kynurenine formamidase
MIVENLTQLTKIVGQKVLFVVAPLKLNCPGSTDNSITRAFALVLKSQRRQ